jgi:glycosyltransferase involved in cell wall biosynthesis
MKSRLVPASRTKLRNISSTLEIKSRQIPNLNITRQTQPTPAIYYLCPTPQSATGGVRNIYRHVDVLTDLGFRASVLHSSRNYKFSWFSSTTAAAATRDVQLYSNDILVIPDYYGVGMHKLPPGPRYVIFNQGAHYTFNHIPFNRSSKGDPYRRIPGLTGILTVSRDSADILEFCYPDHIIKIARLAINPSIFYRSHYTPPRRISFMTHRRVAERAALFHMLRAHGTLDGWELCPIQDSTEYETGEILRSTAIFLSFSDRDGFGLPPAEAMASGCYVIGYTGMGGREFFDPSHSRPIEDGDIASFARSIAEACATYESAPDRLRRAGSVASAQILSYYSVEGLGGDLLDFFGTMVPVQRGRESESDPKQHPLRRDR